MQEFCPRTFLLAAVGPGMTVGQPVLSHQPTPTGAQCSFLSLKTPSWECTRLWCHHGHFGFASGHHGLGCPHQICD